MSCAQNHSIPGAAPWDLFGQSLRPCSQEHQGRLLNEFPDFREELRANGAIDHTVVAGEAEVHAQAGDDLAVFHHRFLEGGTDGQDGGLRRVDDRVKGFDAPRAEVGNRDGATVEFVGLEFLVLGTDGEILDGTRNGSAAIWFPLP